MSNAILMQGDCIEFMYHIPEKSVDMILCDLPYNQTRNEWDCAIPFEPLWQCYNRIIKDNGAIVLFANGIFTAALMLSNKRMWRYNLVWNKVLPSGFLNAEKMPLRNHEDICVFYKKPPTYNPQMTQGKECHSKGRAVGNLARNNNYGKFDAVQTTGNLKYPKSILEYQKPHPSTTVHPTQKPVELLEYLVKTYTNEGDTVLDNCMGSGSTGVACVNTGRNFYGIELDEVYFKIAEKRIAEANCSQLKFEKEGADNAE